MTYSTIDAETAFGNDVLVKLDLSNYATKDITATKVDLQQLHD